MKEGEDLLERVVKNETNVEHSIELTKQHIKECLEERKETRTRIDKVLSKIDDVHDRISSNQESSYTAQLKKRDWSIGLLITIVLTIIGWTVFS